MSLVRRCEEVNPLTNGRVICDNEEPTYKTACQVVCNEGYRLIGAGERICMKNAYWSENEAFCEGFLLLKIKYLLIELLCCSKTVRYLESSKRFSTVRVVNTDILKVYIVYLLFFI